MKDLTDRYVRDLAWTIGSPPMCRPPPGAVARWVSDADCEGERIALDHWLHTLDRDPSPLRSFLSARPSHRLGHYFEALNSYWLSSAPSYERLTEGWVLRRDGETVGELDFVYRNGARVVHLEVAVKFYLRVAEPPEPASYVGPGLRDRFDRKLRKLEREQSRRVDEAVAGELRSALGAVVGEAEVRLKGVLFEPHETRLDRPPELADSSLGGLWIEISRLEELESDCEWHILEKLDWLSGPEPNREGVSFATMAGLLRARTPMRPVQVCERNGSELRRVFVVPEGFSSAARSALA